MRWTAPRFDRLTHGFSAHREANALKQSSPVLPLWPGRVKPKIHAMLKRLLISSFSAVLRHPVDSGIQVCPPLDRQKAARPRSGLREWINSTLPPRLGVGFRLESEEPSGCDDPLTIARRDFIETLADIRTQQAGDLLGRIRLARSLRELWFLRPEVFSLVAHHRDQSEANHRMAVLGAHFPPQGGRSSASRFSASKT